MPALEFQRHSGGATLDLFQLRILIGDAFGKDPDRLAFLEDSVTRFKSFRD